MWVMSLLIYDTKESLGSVSGVLSVKSTWIVSDDE